MIGYVKMSGGYKMTSQQMYNFFRNVYMYVWMKEGDRVDAAQHLRQWGLRKEDWKEMWKNEREHETGEVWKK